MSSPSFRPPPLAAWLHDAHAVALAALCLLLGLWGTPAHAGPVALSGQSSHVALWPYLTVWMGAPAAAALQDAVAHAEAFQPVPDKGETLGVQTQPVWLHAELHVAPDATQPWMLDIDYPPLNRIDVHLLHHGQPVQQRTLGSLLPYAQRPLESRTHALPLQLQAGQQYELLIRVETAGAMVLPISLSTTSAMFARALHAHMLQGVLVGIALCLLVYSLAQWVSVREPLFLMYAVLISGSLLFSLNLFGIGRQYLWTDSLWLDRHMAGLSALLATCGSFLFFGQALWGHQPGHPWLRAMRGGAAATGAVAVAYALDLLNTQAVTALVSILGLVPALMGIPPALRRALRGDALGQTLLLAWAVYFVSTATVIGMIQGMLPVNFWTQHSFQFGATIDMLLFMRVLGLRTQALRTAADEATRERDTMRSLAYTDALTGLVNRRGVQLALSAALSNCTSERIVAVYMVDLDGFKPVNDVHGHDVGDDLLVAVAHRLEHNVRKNTDTVARLGGDEFIVMATGLHTIEEAEEFGGKLLASFKEPFVLGHLSMPIGLTIGYAVAPQDSDDAQTLLRLADAAMYSGKHAGKSSLRRNRGDLALTSA